jgi:hypothetical protein
VKITTLWHPGDQGYMPWLLDAYDEYTAEENDGVPPTYEEQKKKYPDARELIIEVPDGSVEKLFKIPKQVAMSAEPKEG